jgi:hypothetical protein
MKKIEIKDGIKVEELLPDYMEKKLYAVHVDSTIPFLPKGYFRPITNAVILYTKNRTTAEMTLNSIIIDNNITAYLSIGSHVLRHAGEQQFKLSNLKSN